MQTIDEITNYLKNNLTEKRFAHTMGVAETAQSLAEVWGADGSRAFLAGLVHDCAKELSFDKIIEILTENGYSQDAANQDFPMLFHAPCGAILARIIFGFEDADVLNAVRYHTVGRPNMTLLEKIIYVADFIEPTRSFKEAEALRKTAFEDLDKAVLDEADMVIIWNIDRGKTVHPDTVICRNYYLKLTKEGTKNEA